MKKQDIQVHIKSQQEADEVVKMLIDAGEKFDSDCYYSNIDYVLKFCMPDKDWMFDRKSRDLIQISIDQLKQLLTEQPTPLSLIQSELTHARQKHPKPFKTMSIHKQMSILTEEYLEAVQAVNDGNIEHARKELAQVAAVCIRILSGD